MHLWKHIFNGSKRHWTDKLACATAAQEDGYTMFTWNGGLYAVEDAKKSNLELLIIKIGTLAELEL